MSNILLIMALRVLTAWENHFAFMHGIGMRECSRYPVFAHVYFYSTSRIYLHVTLLRAAAQSLQPLKRLVISVRCVWPRVCEPRALWASCSLCLLFTAGEAQRWMRLRVPIARSPQPSSLLAPSPASPPPRFLLVISNRLENVNWWRCYLQWVQP